MEEITFESLKKMLGKCRRVSLLSHRHGTSRVACLVALYVRLSLHKTPGKGNFTNWAINIRTKSQNHCDSCMYIHCIRTQICGRNMGL